MRKLFIVLGMVFMMGCASTLTYNTEGKIITAKDYTIKVNPDGTVTAAPNRWFTTGFLNNLFGGLFSSVEKVAPIVVK